MGAYLLVKAIEDLVNDARFSVFDFGLGDAEYKRKLAHRSIEEGDLAVFAKRTRPIRINVARTGPRECRPAPRRVCAKGRFDASKQWWRQRAARRDRRS